MKFFFIGIKGSGMSALALVLKGMGNQVKGSDISQYFFTQQKLEKENIEIYEFGKYNFQMEDVDEIIIGNSFLMDHIDIQNSKSKNIVVKKYKEKVNELVLNMESIAISGTNGKTTTTAMMVEMLKSISPSYLIGDGTGQGYKNSKKFIFEACEYQNTFLEYYPEYLIINNIIYDHPDFFENLQQVIDSFQKFANQSKYIVVNGDDENIEKITHKYKYTFGIKKDKIYDLFADNIVKKETGIKFDLIYNQQNTGEYYLPFFGEYMLYNSLAVLLVGLKIGYDIDYLIKNLLEFKGANRRFMTDFLTKDKETILVDDYAHHPTAINALYSALNQKYPLKKKKIIFQPHMESRTSEFLDEFADELLNFDEIFIDDTFKAARENNSKNNENFLKKKILEKNEEKIINISDLDYSNLKDSVVCLVGAGDVDKRYKDKIKKMFIGK